MPMFKFRSAESAMHRGNYLHTFGESESCRRRAGHRGCHRMQTGRTKRPSRQTTVEVFRRSVETVQTISPARLVRHRR